jgi:hypothetical protein
MSEKQPEPVQIHRKILHILAEKPKSGIATEKRTLGRAAVQTKSEHQVERQMKSRKCN